MRLFKILISITLFFSCQPNEDHPARMQDDQTISEFMLVKIDDQEILFLTDNIVLNDQSLGIEIVEHYTRSSQLIKLFKFWSVQLDDNSKEILRIGGSIEDFNGAGIYRLGWGEKNNCHVFDNGISWQSHYDLRNEGFFRVSEMNEIMMEGNFSFIAYNSNDKTQSKKVEGQFRLLIDD